MQIIPIFKVLFLRLSFSSAYRMRVWKKMSMQVKHGIPLNESLKILYKNAHDNKLPVASIFKNALSYVEKGQGVGTAFSEFASPEEIMLISSGQKAGRLAEGFQLASELLEARQKISKSIMGALAYPIFLAILCLVMLVIVSISVMPQLATLSDPKAWTGMASILYLTSSFIASPLGFVFGLSIVALIIISFYSLSTWTGKYRLMFENFPPWSFYRLTVGSVWLFTVATLMRAGTPLSQILSGQLSSPTTTKYLRERVAEIARYNHSGKDLGQSLQNCGMKFPDQEIVEDLAIYATLPDFHDNLYELAKEYMFEGVKKIRQKAEIIKVISILIIISLVMGIAISVMSIQQQLLPMGGF